jgi:hypothetical protein
MGNHCIPVSPKKVVRPSDSQLRVKCSELAQFPIAAGVDFSGSSG